MHPWTGGGRAGGGSRENSARQVVPARHRRSVGQTKEPVASQRMNPCSHGESNPDLLAEDQTSLPFDHGSKHWHGWKVSNPRTWFWRPGGRLGTPACSSQPGCERWRREWQPTALRRSRPGSFDRGSARPGKGAARTSAPQDPSDALPLSHRPAEAGRAGVEPATFRSRGSSPRLRNAARPPDRSARWPRLPAFVESGERDGEPGSPSWGRRAAVDCSPAANGRAPSIAVISALAGWPRWGGVLGACLPIPRTCELCRACAPALCNGSWAAPARRVVLRLDLHDQRRRPCRCRS